MFSKTTPSGSCQLIKRLSHPPFLALRIVGWFGSGMGLGWLMRDLTNSAMLGAASWAIKLVLIATIGSQLLFVICVAIRARSTKP